MTPSHQEFYTPISAKNVTFIHQSVSDNMSRSPSDVFPRAAALDSHSHQRHARVVSVGASSRNGYPTQLSLFVIFEKKAGTIRLADSAVGEVDLYEDNWSAQQASLASAPSISSLAPSRRSRASWDGRGFTGTPGRTACGFRFASAIRSVEALMKWITPRLHRSRSCSRTLTPPGIKLGSPKGMLGSQMSSHSPRMRTAHA